MNDKNDKKIYLHTANGDLPISAVALHLGLSDVQKLQLEEMIVGSYCPKLEEVTVKSPNNPIKASIAPEASFNPYNPYDVPLFPVLEESPKTRELTSAETSILFESYMRRHNFW